jgi:hypothetical protein
VERGTVFPVPRGYRAAFAPKTYIPNFLINLHIYFPLAKSICNTHRLGPKIVLIKKSLDKGTRKTNQNVL